MSAVITTKRDIETYLANTRSDLAAVQNGDLATPAKALQLADHPPWGSDWAEWLDSDEAEAALQKADSQLVYQKA